MSPILDTNTWDGKVFTGRWTVPSGGAFDDMEPATGEVLTRVGGADAKDVAASCETAAKAQPDWAARAQRAGTDPT